MLRIASVYFGYSALKNVAKKSGCLIWLPEKHSRIPKVFSSDCNDNQDWRKMVDPKRVLSYEDMLRVIQQPEKVIIDVREPDEVESTGKIPSSINIPLDDVQCVLETMSNEEFQKNFCRAKPCASDELIFYCKSGRRSSKALDKALRLGYTNSKTYLGSWNEWNDKQK